MAKLKGSSKSGGRKKGTPNKRTEERAAAMKDAAEKIGAVIAGAFDGDSHALLMTIYKDPERPIELRMEAAKAAIAYEKPRLAAIEHSGEMNISHEDRLAALE
jgi:hypothetical protein